MNLKTAATTGCFKTNYYEKFLIKFSKIPSLAGMTRYFSEKT